MRKGINFDFTDVLFENLKKEKMIGVYLVKPTGKLLDEDKTYIEVLIGGKSIYAKPCMPFGWFNVPNEKWLQKYSREIGIWVIFEHGNPAYPTWVGTCPLDNKIPSNSNYPNIAVFKTEKYKFEFDDTANTVLIEGEKYSLLLSNSDGVKIIGQNGKTLHIKDNKINLGTADTSAQPAVLGDTNEEVHNQIINNLSQLVQDLATFATTQATASSANPYTAGLAVGFTTLGTSLAAISTALQTVAQLVSETKSKVVSLD